MKIRNSIKKHCWNCEYFTIDNKCTFTGLNKSKNGICNKWKLINGLR